MDCWKFLPIDFKKGLKPFLVSKGWLAPTLGDDKAENNALLKDYELLIADEPFTGLDPTQIAQLKRVFLQQKESGKTVILSSHLLDVVENVCDRFVMIQSGKAVASGTRSELLRDAGLDVVRGSLEDAYLKLRNENE